MIKAIEKHLPERKFIASFNLIEKSVNPCDGLRLVVAPQNDDLIGVSDFQGKEQADDLATLLAAVDVVAHEEVPCILTDNIVALIVFIFVTHFFEHVK